MTAAQALDVAAKALISEGRGDLALALRRIRHALVDGRELGRK